ncbi:hypothetical protein C9439_06320 [archaeon SCG-AAA382B04]|nr:hypothetical protein C9439_06320 [archaeon SCG-AAA382B04]
MKIAQTLSYGFSNSVIKAKKRKLLSDSEIQNLVQSDSISEAVGILDSTVYRNSLYGKTKYKEIDKALSKHLLEVEKEGRRYSPEPLQDVLDIYLKRWEIQNLKLALRIVKSKRGSFRDKAFPYETGLFETIENISKSEDLTEASKVLEETEYGFLEAVFEKKTDLTQAEIKLDQYYYKKLMKKIEKKPKIIQQFFGIQIDKINIETTLRAVKEQIEEEKINKYILPPYKLEIEKLEEIINTEDLKSAVAPLEGTMFHELANMELEDHNTMTKTNIQLQRKIKELSKKIYRIESLGPGVILGFLMLKRLEIQNLRKIFSYKNAGWPNEKIQERLI